MTEVFELKPGIRAKVIAFSICARTGQTIITYELEYQRFIHAEFMTHREFSRNAMSSRAIPIKKMIEQVRNNPAKPVHWGKNQPGMQANVELPEPWRSEVEAEWEEAARNAANNAEAMDKMGSHKQVANRILEPFQWMKTVMTTTSLVNWDWLREHGDADPTIRALAIVMIEAKAAFGKPTVLNVGDWHVPYYGNGVWRDSGYCNGDMEPVYNKRDSTSTLANALAISSSCCAQVSYRLLDDTLEKAQMIYGKLVESEPVHASPFEHQATPMPFDFFCHDCQEGVDWPEGATHVTREGKFCSGNFTNFIQHRQLIPNNVKRG